VALARLGEFVDTHVATHADKRSQLDLDETSRLSTHLHFGEI
jgi:deoxyribodipyrimidine photolyase